MPVTGGTGAQAELASCDGARLLWFVAALAGHDAPDAPDLAMMREIRSEREATRQCEGGGACAVAVAYALENYFGWPAFEGVHLAEDGEPIAPHAWNLLPGDGILDAAADRFGEADIRVLRSGDRDWRRYRREWTEDYNPSLAGRHPELAGCLWTGEGDFARILRRRDLSGGAPWWLGDRDRSALGSCLERRRGQLSAATNGPSGPR